MEHVVTGGGPARAPGAGVLCSEVSAYKPLPETDLYVALEVLVQDHIKSVANSALRTVLSICPREFLFHARSARWTALQVFVNGCREQVLEQAWCLARDNGAKYLNKHILKSVVGKIEPFQVMADSLVLMWHCLAHNIAQEPRDSIRDPKFVIGTAYGSVLNAQGVPTVGLHIDAVVLEAAIRCMSPAYAVRVAAGIAQIWGKEVDSEWPVAAKVDSCEGGGCEGDGSSGSQTTSSGDPAGSKVEAGGPAGSKSDSEAGEPRGTTPASPKPKPGESADLERSKVEGVESGSRDADEAAKNKRFQALLQVVHAIAAHIPAYVIRSENIPAVTKQVSTVADPAPSHPPPSKSALTATRLPPTAPLGLATVALQTSPQPFPAPTGPTPPHTSEPSKVPDEAPAVSSICPANVKVSVATTSSSPSGAAQGTSLGKGTSSPGVPSTMPTDTSGLAQGPVSTLSPMAPPSSPLVSLPHPPVVPIPSMVSGATTATRNPPSLDTPLLPATTPGSGVAPHQVTPPAFPASASITSSFQHSKSPDPIHPHYAPGAKHPRASTGVPSNPQHAMVPVDTAVSRGPSAWGMARDPTVTFGALAYEDFASVRDQWRSGARMVDCPTSSLESPAKRMRISEAGTIGGAQPCEVLFLQPMAITQPGTRDRQRSRASGTTRSKGMSLVGVRWSMEEDFKLYEAVNKFGKVWRLVIQEMPGRSARQCADRWRNFRARITQQYNNSKLSIGAVIPKTRKRPGAGSTSIVKLAAEYSRRYLTGAAGTASDPGPWAQAGPPGPPATGPVAVPLGAASAAATGTESVTASAPWSPSGYSHARSLSSGTRDAVGSAVESV